MEHNQIEQKLQDIEKDDEKHQQYLRNLEVLQEYQGEDRVLPAEDLYEEVKSDEPKLVINSNKTTLDKLLGGFREGQLVVISAPTGQGKTTFCQTLTMDFLKQDLKSIWFSYEVGIVEFMDKFPEIPSFFMPRRLKQNSMQWLETRIMEGVAKYDCKIVFIDHLHYLLEMQKMAEAKSLSLLVGMMMRELKRIAIDNEIVIFLVSHMRKSTYRIEKVEDLPDIDSLRDSSFVGQESDVVLFLNRMKEKDDNGHQVYTNETILKVAKNRRTGNLGYVKLYYKDKRFDELSLNHIGYAEKEPTQSTDVGLDFS